MGLSRAQFTQVVLLPQGEFARFLRADDDARRELLTTLFGTHLYDRITDDLDSRRYDAEQARAEARHHVEHALAAAGQAAGLDADARDALVALGPTAHEQELALIATGLAAADQQAQVAADLARSRLASAATAGAGRAAWQSGGQRGSPAPGPGWTSAVADPRSVHEQPGRGAPPRGPAGGAGASAAGPCGRRGSERSPSRQARAALLDARSPNPTRGRTDRARVRRGATGRAAAAAAEAAPLDPTADPRSRPACRPARDALASPGGRRRQAADRCRDSAAPPRKGAGPESPAHEAPLPRHATDDGRAAATRHR